jgi:hypothetical protein
MKMAKTLTTLKFKAKLSRPGGADTGAPWIFLNLPQDASDELPSRSMVSVEGSFNGFPFYTTLLPDGQGGHWLQVDPKLSEGAGVKAGDVVELEITPMAEEPEPEVPDDVQTALEAAGPVALATWADITPVARRDWIFWIVSGKKAETRVKRIEVAMSKLSAGNRRPCCFDRSGMYDKSLSCPLADEGA